MVLIILILEPDGNESHSQEIDLFYTAGVCKTKAPNVFPKMSKIVELHYLDVRNACRYEKHGESILGMFFISVIFEKNRLRSRGGGFSLYHGIRVRATVFGCLFSNFGIEMGCLSQKKVNPPNFSDWVYF